MKFYIIQSGSKGNATILEHNNRLLLIDDGISYISIKSALESLNFNIMNVEALLITHEHSDHTKGIKYLPPLPIYTKEGTYDGDNVNYIDYFKPFELIGLKITPLLTSHDAINPCGFLFVNQDEKLVYMTDTGYIPELSLDYMNNADYYIIESNHDVNMQLDSNRPAQLINRILSDEGHLSNVDSASYMASLVGQRTKQIFLAHISQDANTPEIALSTYKKIFKKKHINLDNIEIICTSQTKMVKGGNK